MDVRILSLTAGHLGATAIIAGLVSLASPQPGTAQSISPYDALQTLIARFQQCGYSPADVLMGAVLFQTVAAQTNGTGCYAQLQALGPLTRLTETGRTQLPAGPVANFTAVHQNGRSYWQIGVSNLTGKVELLNTSLTPPPSPVPPDNDEPPPKPLPDRRTKPVDPPLPPADPNQSCLIYPEMCRKKQ